MIDRVSLDSIEFFYVMILYAFASKRFHDHFIVDSEVRSIRLSLFIQRKQWSFMKWEYREMVKRNSTPLLI